MREPSLSDGALTLSPLRLEDAAAHLAGEDEQLVRWYFGGPGTSEGVEAYLRHCQQQWVAGGPLRAFAIRAGTEQILAGTIDLRFAGEGLAAGQVNVSYGIYPAWRGRGLATRAVDLVCHYATEHGANTAIIKAEPANPASARVALRAGFTYAGQIHEPNGTVFDRYQRTLVKGLVVRIAESADIDAVFEIRTSVTENQLSYQQLTELGITKETVRDALEASPCLWIAELKGTAAGFAMVDVQAGSVFACFIHPQYQGHGLGRLLMERAEAFLFQRHTTIWLTTNATSPAPGFYRKLGWSAASDLPDDSIRFEKHRTTPVVVKMHDDEVDIDAHLVRRLLAAQFPQWADLPLTPVPSAGTDNAMYRLGENLAVRIPRIGWAVQSLRTEQHWLPRIAGHLPLACPIPVGVGTPAEGFEWPWSVCCWVEGDNPVVGRLTDPIGLAQDLAVFITALRTIDPTGGPPTHRGSPLAVQDKEVRAALPELDGLIDVRTAMSAWEEALDVPVYDGPPMWFHGDLSPFNLLTKQGRLSGVIDFGLMGVGDPSIDLIPAWNLLPPAAREQFRTTLGVDDHTWARGRGWALSGALIALPYYKDTNPRLADNARHVIGEILTGHQHDNRTRNFRSR